MTAVSTLHVGRLRASYKLPAASRVERSALDGALVGVLEEALERAIERSPLGGEALVCIRRLHVPVSVRSASTESAVVEAWSAAIVAALRDTAARPGPGVVRYASRREALADVAAGVAAGDLARAWAWRRLGLWDGPDTMDSATGGGALVRTLLGQPRAIVAVVAAVAEQGALAGLVSCIDGRGWSALAAAALGGAGLGDALAREVADTLTPAAGGRTLWPGRALGADGGDAAEGQAGPVRPAAGRPAVRAPDMAERARVRRGGDLLAASALLRAAGGVRPAASEAPVTLASLAVLGCLDADPGLGHMPDARARAVLVAGAAALLALRSAGGAAGPAGPGAAPAADAARDGSPATGAGRGPAHVRLPADPGGDGARAGREDRPSVARGEDSGWRDHDGRPRVEDRSAAAGRSGAEHSLGTGRGASTGSPGAPDAGAGAGRFSAAPAHDVAGRRRPAPAAGPGAPPGAPGGPACQSSRDDVAGARRSPGEPGPQGAADGRESAATAFGGLAFLLHLVHELELPDRLLGDGPLADRPLRWSLHQIAMTLTGAEPDDPAALAFAGLTPHAGPPSDGVPSATAAEAASLSAAAARIGAVLASRLRTPFATDLVARTCARRADVRADPGWIELHLALDEVDVDVRRSGLDHDPGFVPWLGAVVRFVYA